MWRNILIGFIVLFGLFIAVLFWSEQLRNKPFRWTYNLKSYSKQPYGTKVFFDRLGDLFPGKKIKRLHKVNFNQYFFNNPRLDTLSVKSLKDYPINFSLDSAVSNGLGFNFISIQNYLNPRPDVINALINHALEGGNSQLYAFNFSELLARRLEFEMKSKRNVITTDPPIKTADSVFLMGGGQPVIKLRRKPSNYYFESYPELAEVLLQNDFGEVLGIKLFIGQGSISLFTIPHIFSNYDLLFFNRKPSELLINRLPLRDTYWSNDLNYQFEYTSDRSLLAFIMNNSSLKWAYYLLLISLLSYLGLLIQRKQGVVPIRSQPQNLSLSFLRTISDLHASKRDYKSILQKKMNFLLARIKSKYHMDTGEFTPYFFQKLAKRSNQDQEELSAFFKNYQELMKDEDITEREFKNICKMFQRFKY